MPYRYVHLKTGAIRDSINNPAEIGTAIIEFGTLSKHTGDPIYYAKAKKALVELYRRRSPIGLVGTWIDVETGEWVNTNSHISGAIDSYYEYLLKASLLFDDEECVEVLRWAEKNPVLQGRVRKGYSYNFDLYKFCRKVFAYSDACLKEDDLVFWLDADVRLLKPIPIKFLDDLLRGHYCGVLGRKGFHIESGIVGVNAGDEVNEKFMRRYRELYLTGEVLQLKGWHDCWAFMAVMHELKVPAVDWTGGHRGSGAVVDTSAWRGALDGLGHQHTCLCARCDSATTQSCAGAPHQLGGG